MPIVEYGGVKFGVDEEGYLLNYEDWNEKIACALAEMEGVEELTKERMDVIKFMREYYKKYNYFPILVSVCAHVHQPKDCMQVNFMEPLSAWKIAGLPKPNPQVVGYLRGEGGVV